MTDPTPAKPETLNAALTGIGAPALSNVTGIASGLKAGIQADVAAVKAEGKSLYAKVTPYLYPAAALALGLFVGKHL